MIETLPLQKIDTSKPVSGRNLDLVNYSAKFDYYRRHWKEQEYFKTICSDPTLFSYAFFKNDENKAMQLIAPQDCVACEALKYKVRESKPNDSRRYIVYRASNQTGKCVHAEERIINSKGLPVRMKDLKINETVASYHDGKLTYGIITDKQYTGKKKSYLIKTYSGKEIHCSADHKFLTPSGWKSINTGLHKHNYRNKSDYELSSCSSMLSVPKSVPLFGNTEMTDEQIKTVSYMMTDGYMGNDEQSPKFTNTTDLLLNEFEESVKSFGINNCKRYKKIKGNESSGTDIMPTFSFNRSNPLSDYMRELGIWKPKKERNIPQEIMTLPKEKLALFINRIYSCDGTVFNFSQNNKLKTRLMFYSPSKDFVLDLKELLLKFGVHSNLVIDRPTKRNEATQNGYRLTCQHPQDIINFFDNIGFIYSKDEKSKKSYELCKNEILTRKCDVRKKYADKDFFWDFITKIEEDGEDEMYDVTVETEHNFICSGVVMHNSHLEIILIIIRFLREKNINQALVTNRRELTTYLIRQIKLLLDNSNFHDWRGDFEDSENATTITLTRKEESGFTTVNRIFCIPAGQGGLGYPIHYLYLDECDFYENGKNLFYGIFNPRTKKTKGQIFAISNPNYNIAVTDSLLYEMWTGDLFQTKFHFNLLDAPWFDQDEFDRDKKNTASYIFASTHLGEFSNLAGGFFSAKEIQDMLQINWNNELPIVNRPIYISLDLAKVHDNSVLCLGYIDDSKDKESPDLVVKYLRKFETGTDYTVVIDEVKRIVDYYTTNFSGVAQIGYDATGVGIAVGDIMTDRGLCAEPIVFSMTNKSKMYANFKMLAEQRRIKVVYDEDCEKQLSNLVFDKTTSGNLQIKHSKEIIHDDFCDGLAIMCSITINPEYTESSLILC